MKLPSPFASLVAILGFGLAALATSVGAQERPCNLFEFTLAAGIAGNDALENSHEAIMVVPAVALTCSEPPCLTARLPIVRWPKRKDPVWLKQLRPLGDPLPRPVFRVEDLDIGPTLGAFPEVALSWPGDRFTPELFVGVGFLAEGGQTTRVGNLRVSTDPVNSPALTYGLGLGYDVSDRLGLRLEARGFTAFPDSLTITARADDGRTSVFSVEGGSMQLSMVTAGVTLRF